MERQGILQNRHTEGLHLHPTHPQDHWPHQTESGAYFVHTSGSLQVQHQFVLQAVW